eukprot:10820-Heterococcus_DN1.PRE.10
MYCAHSAVADCCVDMQPDHADIYDAQTALQRQQLESHNNSGERGVRPLHGVSAYRRMYIHASNEKDARGGQQFEKRPTCAQC